MPPIIGIPLAFDDCGRWRTGREYEYIDIAYARALVAAGGAASYLPLDTDSAAVMERVDGLLIPGGDDFLPDIGTTVDRSVFTPTPQARIDMDLLLLGRALERGIPILGICYGMQLLVLHHGGRLLYHIPTECPNAGDHQLPHDSGRHALIVEAGTRLAGILGERPGPVNSLHHQGVAEPGDGLQVCARSGDGLIEAVEGRGAGFCLGVQWHPEKMVDTHRTALFAAFVAACGEPPPA